MNKIAKYLLTISFFSLCFFSCVAQHTTGSSGLKSGQAWKIVRKVTMTPLPEANPEELQKYKENKAEADTVRSVILLSNSFYKTDLTEKSQKLRSRKDSTVYMIYKDSKIAYRLEAADWRGNKQDQKKRYELFKLFPDSTKTILGRRCHKAVFKPAYGNIDITYTAWYASDFPSWIWENMAGENVPGMMLELSFVKNHIKVTIKATDIKKVPINPADFKVPEGYRIFNADGSVYDRAFEKQKKAYEKAQDSLLSVLEAMPSDKVYEEGSAFHYGFARVEVNDSTHYYVDQTGEYAFDKIISTYHPIQKITPTRPGLISIDRNKSVTMLIVSREGRFGLISSTTGWVLPAKFDQMSIAYDRYLLLAKNEKRGYTDTWGNNLVPVKFDEVKIMDKQRYDVKIGNKWGVYNSEKEKLILPAEYDDFDFCGGCGGTVDYAYAQKNGKWGILTFEGEVLVPFNYEHPGHYGMRSDNWVTSYEKNGKAIVINMNGNRVYGSPKYSDMEIISGVLAAKKNGKYGLINKQNEVVSPFIYDDIGHFYDNFHWGPYILVYQNNKAGVVTNTGKVVVPTTTYDHIFGTGEGYFGASKNKKWVLLDTLGNLISPNGYEISGFRYPEEAINTQGKKVLLFTLKKDTLVGLYNLHTKQVIVEPKFSSVDVVQADSTHYFVEVEIEGEGKGLYTLKGEEVLPPQYTDYEFLNNELVRVRTGDYKFGIYSLKEEKAILPLNYSSLTTITPDYYLLGKLVDSVWVEQVWDVKQQRFYKLQKPYDHITELGGPFIAVYDSAHAYLYNLEKRRLVSAKEYDSFGRFRHGLISVDKDDKEGYINATGEVVIPLKYDDTKSNKRGIIRLFKKTGEYLWKYGYADTTGTLLTPIKYTYGDKYNYTDWDDKRSDYLKISTYDKGTGKNLFGMMTGDGKEIVPPIYEKVYAFENEKGFLVKSRAGWGILNETGKILIPPVLDNVFFNETSSGDFVKSMRYPVFCELDDYYFYVTHSGEILPFTTKGRMPFQKRSGWW